MSFEARGLKRELDAICSRGILIFLSLFVHQRLGDDLGDGGGKLAIDEDLDDAWNSQDWDTFNKRHAETVAVYWPGQLEPTRGRKAHQNEAVGFFKTFPDNHVENNPYKILFGQGDYTCSVAEFTGTMKGHMMGPGGKTIPPTNKKFRLEFCTIAHWKSREIIEEKLFYDLAGMMKQLGLK